MATRLLLSPENSIPQGMGSIYLYIYIYIYISVGCCGLSLVFLGLYALMSTFEINCLNKHCVNNFNHNAFSIISKEKLDDRIFLIKIHKHDRQS